MPFYSQCDDCCGCPILIDNYDNRAGNLDEDGVNLPDSTVYTFVAGTWSVNVGTGTLVSNSDSDPIYFHTGANRLTNVSIRCNLASNGDWAGIVFGGNNITATRVDSGTVNITGAITATQTLIDATNYVLKALFYKSESYSEFDCIEPSTTNDYVRYNEFVDCPQGTLDASAGFSNWGLKAKSGVHLDNLNVWRATPSCQAMTLSCASICSIYPDTITVSISGAVNGQAWCGPTSAPANCSDDLFDCLLAAEGATAPDSLARCVATCACYAAYNDCHCGYVEANGSCVSDCQCETVNGEHVMDRDNDCSCNYSTTIPYYTRGLDYTLECPLVEQEPLTISGTLQYEYCDTETGQAYVSLYMNMPFSSPTVAYWWSGIIPAADFCEGGTIPLQTYPEGAAQYADEILLGCALGCGMPSGYGCGDGPFTCTYDGDQEYDCNVNPVEVLCPHAEHTAVSIGDAVVA